MEGKQFSGALIKKGHLPVEPVPVFGPLIPAEDSFSSSMPPKTIQIFHEHHMGQVNSPVETVDMGKIREEAKKIHEEAKSEAEQIIAEAQNKSKKLIEQSKLYCETAKANAEREGFAEGKKEGKSQGLEEVKNSILAARDLLAQLTAERDEIAKKAEPNLAKLAVKIAERVIASEVSVNPAVIVNMVKANLERVKEREQVILHVHPGDLETVKAKQDFFTQLIPSVRNLEIQADPRIEQGGCMIETDFGILDARISTQLEAIEQAFSSFEGKKEES